LLVVPDRAQRVAAAIEVGRQRARDLAGPPGVRGLEPLPDRLVQPTPGRRREAPVHDLLEEHVTEGVARARLTVRPRARASVGQDLLLAYQPVAHLLHALDVIEVTAGQCRGDEGV